MEDSIRNDTREILLQHQVDQGTQKSPITTRARARQLQIATLITSEGVHRINTTPHVAYVPGTVPGSQSPNLEVQPEEIPVSEHQTFTEYVTTDSSTSPIENTERRYVHVGSTVTTPTVQQQIADLQRQVHELASKSENSSTSPPQFLVAGSQVPQTINIVSKEPVFPTLKPRTYTEEEKLIGQVNFHKWKTMMLRDLRMCGLMPFIESPLAKKTSWTESTRLQGDALTQKLLLQAVSSLILAQVCYCKDAFQIWVYLQFAYEDVNALQLNTSVREVDKIIPEECSSVHEIFDKLIALQTQSVELGENLPESYWLTEANRLVSDFYPREVCEALQSPKCTLMTMRRHFQAFVKEPCIRHRAAIPPQYFTASCPPTVSAQQQGYMGQSSFTGVFPSPEATSSPTVPVVPQGTSYSRPIVYPPPAQVGPPPLTPLKARIQRSAAFRPQYTSSASGQQPVFPPKVQTIPPIEQPRYPPPGTYWQTIPNRARQICYSCGLSGHRAEFCPNYNLPVCYKCKGIGHKRPQCPCYWLPDDRYSTQPLVPPSEVRPLLSHQQPTAGTIFNVALHSLRSTGFPTFLLDSGATHHIVSDPSLLINFVPKPFIHNIYLADKIHILNTIGYGTMSITISNSPNIYTTLMLSNVLVCTSVAMNIISVRKLCTENKVIVLFNDSYASVHRCAVDADNDRVGDNELGTQLLPNNVSPKGLSSPNDCARVSYSLSSPLFSLNISNGLYTFRLNTRAFSDLSTYNRVILTKPRDPRPFMVLNVASMNGAGGVSENLDVGEDQQLLESEGEHGRTKSSDPVVDCRRLQDSEGEQLQESESGEAECEAPARGPLFRTKSGKSKTRDAASRDSGRKLEEYAQLWHRRLGHVSLATVRQVLQQQRYRPIPSTLQAGTCEVCALAKQKEKSYDKCRTQGTRPGEIICADLIGPITPHTYPRNFRFILTAVDTYSRFARVFPLKKKSDTSHYLKVLFDEIRGQFPAPGQMRVLRTDQGKEFLGAGVKQLLFEYGLKHEVSEKFVSQHNGLVERFNRTLQERSRALLADSGFPRSMWDVVVAAAEFLYN